MSHNNQKKIAVINAMAGFGRCSLSVSMPIISYMGIQCCPVPTSILSNHTGYPEYFFDDYTDRMDDYISKWRSLDLKFEGITSGFLGSKKQIETVIRFIEEFRSRRTTVIIDPVMGDHGRTYATYTPEMCTEMKRLAAYADIITPNLTECCHLTDTPYKEIGWTKKELQEMAERLFDLKGKSGFSDGKTSHSIEEADSSEAYLFPKDQKKVVITGIQQGEFIANFIMEKGKESRMIRTHKAGTERSGTGDIFAAIIAADAVNGVEFGESVKKASSFVKKSILKSMELAVPQTDGACFEEILHTLKRN